MPKLQLTSSQLHLRIQSGGRTTTSQRVEGGCWAISEMYKDVFKSAFGKKCVGDSGQLKLDVCDVSDLQTGSRYKIVPCQNVAVTLVRIATTARRIWASSFSGESPHTIRGLIVSFLSGHAVWPYKEETHFNDVQSDLEPWLEPGNQLRRFKSEFLVTWNWETLDPATKRFSWTR